MSTDNNRDWQEPSKQVTDEEGTVDQKYKNRIINIRDRVDKREDEIFVGVPLDPQLQPDGSLAEIWATSVKQYLKAIEPLLRSDDIEKSQYFYEEIDIVNRKVLPPDGKTVIRSATQNGPVTKEVRWSRLYRDDLDMRHVIGDPNTPFETGFEPPEPKTVKIQGLKDIIEVSGISLEWHAELNPRQFGNVKQAEVRLDIPLRREWLETAVRKADLFLQEYAGIGVDVGHRQKDEQDDTPF